MKTDEQPPQQTTLTHADLDYLLQWVVRAVADCSAMLDAINTPATPDSPFEMQWNARPRQAERSALEQMVEVLRRHEKRNITDSKKQSVWASDVDLYVLHERLCQVLLGYERGRIEHAEAIKLLRDALQATRRSMRKDLNWLNRALNDVTDPLKVSGSIRDVALNIIEAAQIERSRWTQRPVGIRTMQAIVTHYNGVHHEKSAPAQRAHNTRQRDEAMHGLNYSPGDLAADTRRRWLNGTAMLRHVLHKGLNLPPSALEAIDQALTPDFEALAPAYREAADNSEHLRMLEAQTHQQRVLAQTLRLVTAGPSGNER